MKEWFSRYSFSFFFLSWIVLFFPGWYVLSYTKVDELSQMIFQDRSTQLQVLHPAGEMSQLLELRHSVLRLAQEKKVAVRIQPKNASLPLATDISMQRAVLFPIPVASVEEQSPPDLWIVPVVAKGTGEVPFDEECKDQFQENIRGEEICWTFSPLR